jgi:hypothetical protein
MFLLPVQLRSGIVTHGMTLDQKIQIWVAVGTWVAGLATVGAVIVALYLTKKVERVKLKVHVGLRELVMGDGSPLQEHLSISVTNLGERAVTINSVGWAVGKGKHRKVALQPVAATYTTQYPVELTYGKEANFMVSFLVVKNWVNDFATGFVHDLSDRNLKTLVALIQTSVGQTIEVRPESNLLEALKKYR